MTKLWHDYFVGPWITVLFYQADFERRYGRAHAKYARLLHSTRELSSNPYV